MMLIYPSFLLIAAALTPLIHANNRCDDAVYRCPNGQVCLEHHRRSECLERNGFVNRHCENVPIRQICLNVDRICAKASAYSDFSWKHDHSRQHSETNDRTSISHHYNMNYQYDDNDCRRSYAGDGDSCTDHAHCRSVAGGISMCCHNRCVHVHNIPCVRDFFEPGDRHCSSENDCDDHHKIGSPSSTCPSKVLPTHLRVLAFPDQYVVAANATTNTPNSGFLVDLLDALQEKINLTYTLTVRPDLTFGNPAADGSFNGSLIGKLISCEADVIGADVIIDSSRVAVVDFVNPFSSFVVKVVFSSQYQLNNGSGQLQYVAQDNVILHYLKVSTDPDKRAIYQSIQDGKPDSIVASDSDGFAKVLSSTSTQSFAYICQSPSDDDALEQFPTQINRSPLSLGKFFLSLAIQKGSPLGAVLDVALAELIEASIVDELLTTYNVYFD